MSLPSVMGGLIPQFNWGQIQESLWSEDAWMSSVWILVLGGLIGLVCGILGCFLLLRRMALTGDAISHSVLPGVVAAYVIFGTLAPWAMMLGAGTAGVLAVVLIEVMVRKSRLKSDAATGVAFTTLFALGVLMIRKFANRAHLDVDCVLFGHLELTLFETIRTPWGFVPESVVHMLVITLVVMLLVWLCYKELQLTSFDPALARCLGLRVNLIHYGLMTATALVVVAALEAVGAVLVVGMLIVPPASARLLTQRLPSMLALTAVFVASGTAGELYLATWLKTPLAASMMVVSTLMFLGVWVAGLAGRKLVRS